MSSCNDCAFRLKYIFVLLSLLNRTRPQTLPFQRLIEQKAEEIRQQMLHQRALRRQFIQSLRDQPIFDQSIRNHYAIQEHAEQTLMYIKRGLLDAFWTAIIVFGVKILPLIFYGMKLLFKSVIPLAGMAVYHNRQNLFAPQPTRVFHGHRGLNISPDAQSHASIPDLQPDDEHEQNGDDVPVDDVEQDDVSNDEENITPEQTDENNDDYYSPYSHYY